MAIRILITGICGFAGSTLAKSLLARHENLEILGLDNLSRKGSELNLLELRQLGLQIHVGDLRIPEDIALCGPVDWVIDAAANPSVLAGVDGSSPATLLNHNLFGTVHLLEHCRKYGATFTLLSTSRVYSIPALANIAVQVEGKKFTIHKDATQEVVGLSSSGIAESFSTAPPLSLYGSSKLCSELLALEYGATYGFPVWINRCGVLAGSGQFGKADQGIFSYWIHSWMERKPLKYLGFGGYGHQVRDCLHPQDLTSLIWKQFEHQLQAIESRVINVSGGVESAMSLAELSDWCESHMGPHKVIQDGTVRPFDLPWLILDSQCAHRLWDWKPETSREDILQQILVHAHANPQWSAICSG